MFLSQYYLDCLSQASYLIADEATGQAVVVDPRRDISEYVADADAHGLKIEGVINTHFHADFVAGHLELAATTGAWIGYGRRAEAEYPIRKLSDGERVSLGDVTLQIMETPGHTPESISILVFERGDAVPTTCHRRRAVHRRRAADLPPPSGRRPRSSAGCSTTACNTSSWRCRPVRVFRPAPDRPGEPHRRQSTIGEQRRTIRLRSDEPERAWH
jgi:hypothetical protein